MVGFQWQNPQVEKIHTHEDVLLSAHLVRDYLDTYKMDYTLSVYIPETALQHSKLQKYVQHKEELGKLAGLDEQDAKSSEAVIV